MPLHVVQAEEASKAHPTHPVTSFAVGDARALGRPDDSADAVLLLMTVAIVRLNELPADGDPDCAYVMDLRPAPVRESMGR